VLYAYVLPASEYPRIDSLLQLTNSQAGCHLTPTFYSSLHWLTNCSQSQSQSQSHFTTGALPSIVRLDSKPLESHDQYFFQLNTCGYSPYATSSLTRGWVCRLQLLLVLASVIIIGSKSRRPPNLEGRVPVFISPRNRVAQLYTQALGSNCNSKLVPLITSRHGLHRKHRTSLL
jgi:hypothetical protein